MMASLLALEDFGRSDDPMRLIVQPAHIRDAERAAARAEGHAAGRAEAEAEAAARASNAQAALAGALADLDVTHAEMRAHILRALAPLLRAMSEVLVPRLAALGLADHLIAGIGAQAGARAGAPLVVAVAPEEADALRAALGGALAHPPEIAPEPGRQPGTARIAGLAGDRVIDTARAGAEISALLDAFLELEHAGDPSDPHEQDTTEDRTHG